MSRPPTKTILRVPVPNENECMLVDGYYLSLGRVPDGRLVAVISEGHPKVGDGATKMCDIEVVADRTAAAAWFAETLLTKPWLPRS